MRIRSIHLKGHKELGDVNVDFRREDGVIPRSFGIWGNNKSGKSLLLRMAQEAWAGSVSFHRNRSGMEGVSGYVSYECNKEIFVVRMNNGLVEKNSGLSKFCNLERAEHCVLHYGRIRFEMESRRGGRNWGTESLLRDVMRPDAPRESVALIDDFGTGLDSLAREKLYAALFRYHAALNNQIIIADREEIKDIPGVRLQDGADWIDGLVEDIKRGTVSA